MKFIDSKRNLTVLGFFVGSIATLFLIYILYKNGLKKKADAEILKNEKLIEMERKRYEILTKREEDIAKIRHDYKNQILTLMSISECMSAKNEEEKTDET